MRKHKRLLKFTTIFLGVIVFCVMCPLSSFGAVGIPINTSDYIYSQADIFDSVYSDVVIDSSPSPIFYSTTMDPTQNIPEFLKNPNVNQFESITTGWHSLGSNPGQVLPTLSSSKYIYNGSHYESDEISFSAPSGHYGLVFVPVFPFSFSEFLSKYDLEDININQSYLSVSFHIWSSTTDFSLDNNFLFFSNNKLGSASQNDHIDISTGYVKSVSYHTNAPLYTPNIYDDAFRTIIMFTFPMSFIGDYEYIYLCMQPFSFSSTESINYRVNYFPAIVSTPSIYLDSAVLGAVSGILDVMEGGINSRPGQSQFDPPSSPPLDSSDSDKLDSMVGSSFDASSFQDAVNGAFSLAGFWSAFTVYSSLLNSFYNNIPWLRPIYGILLVFVLLNVISGFKGLGRYIDNKRESKSSSDEGS